MSGDAASLACPVCSHIGIFKSVQALRDKLIHISTNNILCPVCQEEVCGLDKLTIHLFSHVKLLSAKGYQENVENTANKDPVNSKNQVMTQKNKPKISVVKNKISIQTTNPPVKFVKIYPKLPVLSVNTVQILDVSLNNRRVGGEQELVKTEASIVQVNNTTCNVCGLQFIDANILKMHKCLIHNIDENSNQNFTRYNCHLCPKTFKMRGSLMVHLRVAHFGLSSDTNGVDGGIEKETNGLNMIQGEKLTNMDKNGSKQWQCEVCRKCFTTKYFLKKHKRLHTGETPYACTQCNKTFTFQQSYHKHLLYHNDEKPHTCSFCGRSFKELSTLHNHQRIHTGEKPFSCETCGKCFRQRVSYLVHRRIHTGVMPYKCTACQKSFRYKVSQRTHKCQAQPPGTVIRQTGDLVEKLRKKQEEPVVKVEKAKTVNKLNFTGISEANVELIRTGAKLSLEDLESEHFCLLSDVGDNADCSKLSITNLETKSDDHLFNHNIEDIIKSIPIEEKNIPSPSEILRNLCLSNDDDYIGILNERVDEKNSDICKDFNMYL